MARGSKSELKPFSGNGRAVCSRLLNKLSAGDRALLDPHLELVELPQGEVLFEPGDDVMFSHFPCDRMLVSFVVVLSDGQAVEAATIGREGAVGGIVSLGHKPAFSRAVVQVSGKALRIDSRRLEAAKGRSPTLRDFFARYADVLLAQLMQATACNAVHSIEARFCRFLLVAQDRVGGDELRLTQEFLAEALGVQRTYVTRVARGLRDTGLIEYRRGRITILNRGKLEQAACECYGAVERHFETLMPGLYPHPGDRVAKPRRA